MSDEQKKIIVGPGEKGLIDHVLQKVISRKLLVFAVATGLLLANAPLDSETWGWVALVYIGGQSAVDTMKAYRGN